MPDLLPSTKLLHCSETGGWIQQICAMRLICECTESTQRLSCAMIAPLTDAGRSCPLVTEVLDLCGSPQLPVEQIYKRRYTMDTALEK